MATTSCRSTMVRWPARLLIGAGTASIVGMLFHPAAQGDNAEARLHSLAAISPLAMHVHLLMVTAVIALWLAMARVARQWPESDGIWVGTRLYSLGAGAMLGAALISGFLIDGYLARMRPVSVPMENLLPSLALAFAANQALAGFGMVLMSLAISAWSLAILRQRNLWAVVCGIHGLGVGGVCVAAYAGRWLSLDVAGMTAVVVAHGVWYCLFGLGWLRGTPQRAEPD